MVELSDGMILYHGSYCEVKIPDLAKCSAFKDFGKGFYLTSSKEQADDLCISRLIPERLKDQFCFRTDRGLRCLSYEGSEQIWKN